MDVPLSRFLGSRAVAVLNHWFQLNRDYPYPDDERTERLADEAGKAVRGVKDSSSIHRPR